MRTWMKWLLLLALLAYATGMSVWAYNEVRSMRCRGIDVIIEPVPGQNASFLRPDAVKRELGSIAANWAKMPLNDINTRALEQHLNTINNFEHAEVLITSSGRLQVRVIPMIPEARIFTPTETYYINKDGKRLDAHPEYYADLPLVHGNFSRRMPASNVLPVTRYIRGDDLLRNLITMVDYRDPRNILLVPRIHGHIINLGDTSRLADKFSRLKLFYRQVLPHQGWEKYDTISVKYRGQIVATRADKRLLQHNNVADEEEPDETPIFDQEILVPIDTTKNR